MKYNYVFPMIAAIAVIIIPATLITVAVRSPYTHANLFSRFTSDYTRTDQIEVGPPLLYRPPALANQFDATVPIEERGKSLLVARGCAGCHGMDGMGGAVGPRLIPDIEVLRDNVRRGPRGMPVFAPQDVTDYDLTAIAAYLKSVSSSPPSN